MKPGISLIKRNLHRQFDGRLRDLGLLSQRRVHATMKRGAVVINVGRGPVIHEEALVRALSEERIKGAALDVFDHELLPPEHPFYRWENLLLSPHCADHTPDWLEDAMVFFAEQYGRFRNGKPPLKVVDRKLGS